MNIYSFKLGYENRIYLSLFIEIFHLNSRTVPWGRWDTLLQIHFEGLYNSRASRAKDINFWKDICRWHCISLWICVAELIVKNCNSPSQLLRLWEREYKNIDQHWEYKNLIARKTSRFKSKMSFFSYICPCYTSLISLYYIPLSFTWISVPRCFFYVFSKFWWDFLYATWLTYYLYASEMYPINGMHNTNTNTTHNQM